MFIWHRQSDCADIRQSVELLVLSDSAIFAIVRKRRHHSTKNVLPAIFRPVTIAPPKTQGLGYG